jgi:hypothetical protein
MNVSIRSSITTQSGNQCNNTNVHRATVNITGPHWLLLVIRRNSFNISSASCRPSFPPASHDDFSCSYPHQRHHKLITEAAWSKAWTVFARSNTGIMGSNPTQGMDACVCVYSVCVVLCVGRGLATGSSPVQGVLPTVYRIKILKKWPRFNKRTVEP